jgi:hypothetical protein
VQEVSVRLLDDFDHFHKGKKTDVEQDQKPVYIGLDGSWFELDLASLNNRNVREQLEPWIAAGRPVKAPVKPRRQQQQGRATAESKNRRRKMRAYADERGHENVGEYHRIESGGYAYSTQLEDNFEVFERTAGEGKDGLGGD